ncbi:MAG: PAS domain-containing protein [Planctomycetota bacterium]
MDKERLVAVVSQDAVRCETIVRAFTAAGFQTIAGMSVGELKPPKTGEPVALILDGRDAGEPENILAEAKRRWPAVHVWGISETAKLMASWGVAEAGAAPSAESLACEGILQQAIRALAPRGGGRALLDRQVREAKQDLESIIDGCPDPIFVCSADNKIVRGNKAFFDKLGKPPAEVVGRPCFEVIHGRSDRWPGCLQSMVAEAGHAVRWQVSGLKFPGAYECTAFEVEIAGDANGLAHQLRETGDG